MYCSFVQTTPLFIFYRSVRCCPQRRTIECLPALFPSSSSNRPIFTPIKQCVIKLYLVIFSITATSPEYCVVDPCIITYLGCISTRLDYRCLLLACFVHNVESLWCQLLSVPPTSSVTSGAGTVQVAVFVGQHCEGR